MKKSSIDIDALWQDSILLVVQLRQEETIEPDNTLWQQCTALVEQARQRLTEWGMDQRAIDHLCYAQCALLDETVLLRAKDEEHTAWAAQPLQAHFFNQHQAGVQLYEKIRDVLREPAPNLAVLTGFHRVLILGFVGRYNAPQAPERVQLLTQLAQRLPPLAANSGSATLHNLTGQRGVAWLSSRVVQVLLAALLLAGQSLMGAVAALLPG